MQEKIQGQEKDFNEELMIMKNRLDEYAMSHKNHETVSEYIATLKEENEALRHEYNEAKLQAKSNEAKCIIYAII